MLLDQEIVRGQFLPPRSGCGRTNKSKECRPSSSFPINCSVCLRPRSAGQGSISCPENWKKIRRRIVVSHSPLKPHLSMTPSAPCQNSRFSCMPANVVSAPALNWKVILPISAQWFSDQLVELGVAHNLTGRPTIPLYGIAL